MDEYSTFNEDNDNTYSFPYDAGDSGGERGCNLTFSWGNCTLNVTDVNGEEPVPRDFAVRVFIGVLLTLIILTTIIGK